jgi:transketolase
LDNHTGWHAKAWPAADADKAIAALGGKTDLTIDVHEPAAGTPRTFNKGKLELPQYKLGDSVATRQAYGDALKALGDAREDIIVLDAEVSNSTMSEVFKKAHPERFFEMFIAEQQMVAAAVGFSVRGYVPFASTFGAFMSRAYDFIRMAAISQANIRLCGSHAGVSIGEDGPSQMALEDVAMLRAVNGSTVLYPSDPNQTAQLVAAMADQPGISYLRTTREKTPVLYEPDVTFKVGGSHVARQSDDDRVTVIAAGITLHEALKAADELAKDGLHVRVVDAYSVKPLDYAGISKAVAATHGRMIVVEDHWPQGGLGSAVLEAFATQGDKPVEFQFRHLAPSELPGSATPAEQLDHVRGLQEGAPGALL